MAGGRLMGHRARVRRVVTLAAIVVMLTTATAVEAARSQRFTDHLIGLECTGSNASGTLYLGLFMSDIDGLSSDLEVWLGSAVPFEDPSTLHRDYDQPVSGSLTSTGGVATVPMIDQAGDPAPSASVTVVLNASGPAEDIDD